MGTEIKSDVGPVSGEVVAESLAPAPQQSLAVAAKRIHSWKSIQYGLQAPIVLRGMRDPQVYRLVGRAVGEREDGQGFTAVVDIPWTMPEDYLWQPRAKERLETFLYDSCKCEARETEERICLMHQTIAPAWYAEDAAEIKKYEGRTEDMPQPVSASGVMVLYELMHRDFPWCRYDRRGKRWICSMCGFTQDATDNNSTWRNQFIRKHGSCGFVDPDAVVPWSIEDKVLIEIGRRMEEEFKRTGSYSLDSARSFVLNQRGTLVIEDSRKPKELSDGNGRRQAK